MSDLRLLLLARVAGATLAKMAAGSAGTLSALAPAARAQAAPALRAPAAPSGGARSALSGGLGWKGNLALGAGVLAAGSIVGRARRGAARPHAAEDPPVHGTGALPQAVNAWGVPTFGERP
jgi:hypothetical protein